MSNIPVLIPIKEHSERCPHKNRYLLPFTAKYLEQQGRLSNAWVISECEELLQQARSLNMKTFLEIHVPGQNERTACWKFLETHYYPEFFICPVTQPFRSPGLLHDMENAFKNPDEIDFVTAMTVMPDREQFYVNRSGNRYMFRIASECRMGATCGNVSMVDGSLYLIKTSFLNNIVHCEDPTSAFWNARFNCVVNKAPFIDIDTEDDLYKFNFLKSYFENKNTPAYYDLAGFQQRV